MPIENPKTSSHDSGHPPTARPLAPSPSSSLHSFIYWLFICSPCVLYFRICSRHASLILTRWNRSGNWALEMWRNGFVVLVLGSNSGSGPVCFSEWDWGCVRSCRLQVEMLRGSLDVVCLAKSRWGLAGAESEEPGKACVCGSSLHSSSSVKWWSALFSCPLCQLWKDI